VPERVLLIRHGQTEWSANGRHTGLTDVPLTEPGREQAAGLANALAEQTFALVLSSPLQRARETCELAGYGERMQLCEDLHEWDYGDYEGLTTPQIRELAPDWNLWRDGCPGGERPEQVGERLDAVLARVQAVDGDVLVFAHGHSLRVLTARWLELPVASGARFVLAPAALGVLGYERDTAVVERWNA
jgi:broad specificity phosphatase PhoE